MWAHQPIPICLEHQSKSKPLVSRCILRANHHRSLHAEVSSCDQTDIEETYSGVLQKVEELPQYLLPCNWANNVETTGFWGCPIFLCCSFLGLSRRWSTTENWMSILNQLSLYYCESLPSWLRKSFSGLVHVCLYVFHRYHIILYPHCWWLGLVPAGDASSPILQFLHKISKVIYII